MKFVQCVGVYRKPARCERQHRPRAPVRCCACVAIQIRYETRIRTNAPLKVRRETARTRSVLVPLTGLEPVRYCYRGILSPLCLPIPPQRRFTNIKHYTTIPIFCQVLFKKGAAAKCGSLSVNFLLLILSWDHCGSTVLSCSSSSLFSDSISAAYTSILACISAIS